MADLLVMSTGVHGMPVTEYAAELRKRLPDTDIQTATSPQEGRELIETASIATGRTLSEEHLDRAQSLEVFACSYAGTDHLPMDRLHERGITVTNASGVHGPNIAEYIIGGILAAVHRFEVADRQQQRREWRHFKRDELNDDTVTIVGLGAIGQAVAERLDPFGVDTIGVRYSPEKGGPTDEVIGLAEETAFESALARSDHLVLACPLTDLTEGLIGYHELQTLPATATLVNVARGPVVDTEALVRALQRGWIGNAVLDVTDPEPLPPDHPLWTFENVRISPHNSGYTPAYYERLADIVAENVRRHRRSEELQNAVNFSSS